MLFKVTEQAGGRTRNSTQKLLGFFCISFPVTAVCLDTEAAVCKQKVSRARQPCCLPDSFSDDATWNSDFCSAFHGREP